MPKRSWLSFVLGLAAIGLPVSAWPGRTLAETRLAPLTPGAYRALSRRLHEC